MNSAPESQWESISGRAQGRCSWCGTGGRVVEKAGKRHCSMFGSHSSFTQMDSVILQRSGSKVKGVEGKEG